MSTENAMLEMARRWREENPDLVRQMARPQRPIGKPGVGKHGTVLNIPNDPNRREPWSVQEDVEITDPHALPLAALSEKLGRSRAAIHSRRYAIRMGRAG
jgi:hypothetical protein